MKPTMTLAECAAAMREHGIHCSASGIADGIESGAYPFGRIKSTGPTGRRTAEIFTDKFYSWIKSPYFCVQDKPKQHANINDAAVVTFQRYFSDPANAIHFSKWCAENLGGL